MSRHLLLLLIAGAFMGISLLHADFIIKGGVIKNQQSGPVNFDTDNDNTHEVVFDTSGNLGLGTLTPESALHVIGDGNISEDLYLGGNLNLTDSLLPSQALLLSDGTESSPALSFTSDTDTGMFLQAAGNLAFTAAGTTGLTIDAGGNIGIGTDAPDGIFHVHTSSNSHAILVDDTTGRVGINSNIFDHAFNVLGAGLIDFTGGGGNVQTSGSGNIHWRNNGADRVVITDTQFFANAADDYGAKINILSPNSRGIAVRGNSATQSGNMLEFQNSAGSSLFHVDGQGNVGIGVTAALSQALTVGGNIIPGANASYTLGTTSLVWDNAFSDDYTITSDRRKKKDISDLDAGREAVLQMKPVSFSWKANPGEVEMGFIAQEIEKIHPSLIHRGRGPEEILGIQYTGMVPILVKAIQERRRHLQKLEQASTTESRRFQKLKQKSIRLR